MPQVIRASNSSMKTATTCETRFVLEYVQGFTGESESAMARAGSDIHKALASYFTGHGKKTVMKVFQDSYEDWSYDPTHFIEERMCYDNVSANLRAWLDRNPWSRLPFDPDPEMVELTVEQPLDENGDLLIVMVLDLLPRAKNEDSYVVADHKTTRAITEWYEKKFVNDSQPTCYIWGARKLLGDDTINRFYANVIALKKLNMTYTKCTLPAHKGQMRANCWPDHVEFRVLGPYERTHEQIRDWHQNAVKIVRKYAYWFDKFSGPLTQEKVNKLNVEGVFNGSCRFCQFQTWCAAGRPAHTLERTFKRKARQTGFGRSGITLEDEDEQ